MASRYAYRYRKPISALGIGIRTSATEADDSSPTITAGSGAPGTTEPNGSIYLRTNAGSADESIYSRVSGGWVAIDGVP